MRASKKSMCRSAAALLLSLGAALAACDGASADGPIAPTAAQPPPAASAAEPAATPVPLRTVVIGVKGMSCASCVAGLQRTLSALEGVREVEVNLEHSRAEVGFEVDRVSVAQIVAAIEEQGYRATPPEQAR